VIANVQIHRRELSRAFRLFYVILFALPALFALVTQGWGGEAGSLSPIVLLLGTWTVWYTASELSQESPEQMGSLVVWGLLIIPVLGIYVFAQAIEMVFLMALAAWAGLVVTFYAWFGLRTLIKCTLPILLTGLAIPLPYSLSVTSNAWLRDFTSHWAVQLADMLGLDVARGAEVIVLGPYVMSVENACAGATSMMSLVAIGVLYAYWMRNSGKVQTLGILLAAIPIAFAANILRVVCLLFLIKFAGVNILDTALHPMSGLISFILSMALLIAWSGILEKFTRTETPPHA